MHVDIATETPALPAASAKRAWARPSTSEFGTRDTYECPIP